MKVLVQMKIAKGFAIDVERISIMGLVTCDRRSLDPRMSVIQDIFKQFKEV